MSQAAPVQNQTSSQDRQALALQKIRPELNLEKWAIWQPAKSKNQPQARVLRREIPLDNGDRVTAQVEVGYTQRGELTTEDQKTYYALIEHWEAHNKPDTLTPLSLNKLAKRLNKKWGTNVIESVTDSLIRLRATTLIWENSYFDSEARETIELLDTFNIISDLKIIKRKKDGVVNREVGYYRFNDFILKNLQSNHTKPLLFHVVLSFKSEIAQLIYTHLDLIFSDKIAYERRTKELFDDLCITGKAYKNPSNRKQILTRALKELNGVPLSKGGIIASATLERTKDQKDYKIVFRKGSAIKPTSKPKAHNERETDDAAATAIYSPKPTTAADQKANELVLHFYKLFHNTQTHTPTAKERAQAAVLIAQYGWTIALYIVNFAYQEAPKTQYQPKTFGGIMHYASHGLADYETHRKERERQEQTQADEAVRRAREDAEQKARQHAQERYEQLSEAARLSLTDTYKARLLAEPEWANASQQGSTPLLNLAIRAAIIQDFMREESGELGEEQGEETVSPSTP